MRKNGFANFRTGLRDSLKQRQPNGSSLQCETSIILGFLLVTPNLLRRCERSTNTIDAASPRVLSIASESEVIASGIAVMPAVIPDNDIADARSKVALDVDRGALPRIPCDQPDRTAVFK